MREYLKYLWQSLLGFLLGLFVGLLCLQKCDRQKLPQPTEIDAKIDSVQVKRDTIINHIPDIRKMIVKRDSIRLTDTVFVYEQLKARDSLIVIQDTLIKLDSTLIGTLYALDSIRVDSIHVLNAKVKRERFFKRFWKALVPVAFIAGKTL